MTKRIQVPDAALSDSINKDIILHRREEFIFTKGSSPNIQKGCDCMNIFQAVSRVFKNAFNFKGRARRREYWLYCLFNTCVIPALAMIAAIFSMDAGNVSMFTGSLLIPTLYSLAAFFSDSCCHGTTFARHRKVWSLSTICFDSRCWRDTSFGLAVTGWRYW